MAAFLAAAVVFAAPQAPAAQQLGEGDEPIDIIAGENGAFDMRQSENLIIATGDPVVTQGDRQLTAHTLHIYTSADENDTRIIRIEADGAVRYRTGLQLVTGERAVYNVEANTIEVNGDVVVTRCTNVVRGGRLVIDLETGDTKIEADKTKRRVRGLLFPKSDSGERPEDCPGDGAPL